MFETTALYAVPLGAIYFGLWMNVARTRVALKQSIGDGGNTLLHERIRAHGNFAEWVPIVMTMMMLAEGLGVPSGFIHVSGALLVIGRLAHPFGLRADNAAHPLRYVGNSTNILAMLNAMVCIAVNLLGL